MLKKLIRYLIQGVLVLAPVMITMYLLFAIIGFLDRSFAALLEPLFGVEPRGFGWILGLMLIAGVGYLSGTLIFAPLFRSLEGLLTEAPILKIVYTSVKDLFSAFISDKKRFDQPVTVKINGHDGFQKIGFLTREDLSFLKLEGMVAVYFPHSYNFSGNLYVVDRKLVTKLNISSSDAMKFIVSGGVTEMEETHIKKVD